MGGAKNKALKTDRVVFFSLLLDVLSYCCPVSPQLPDCSDKLGPVSVTFQTKRRPTGLASAKKTAFKINCVTGVRLQNYGKPSLYRK